MDDKFTRGLIEILKMVNQNKVKMEIAQTVFSLKNEIQLNLPLMVMLVKSEQMDLAEFDKLFAQRILQCQTEEQLAKPLLCAVQLIKTLVLNKKKLKLQTFAKTVTAIHQKAREVQVLNNEVKLFLLELEALQNPSS